MLGYRPRLAGLLELLQHQLQQEPCQTGANGAAPSQELHLKPVPAYTEEAEPQKRGSTRLRWLYSYLVLGREFAASVLRMPAARSEDWHAEAAESRPAGGARGSGAESSGRRRTRRCEPVAGMAGDGSAR